MDYKICHNCGDLMFPCKISKAYNVNGKFIKINDINAFKCIKCDSIVFTNEEVKQIEDYIHKHMEE